MLSVQSLLCVVVFSFLVILISADPPTDSGQFTTAPQCKCDELDECSRDFFTKQTACKREEKCLKILKKVGDSKKIRECLDVEHATVQKVEQCVKKKINGELGCTNDAVAKNLTIPLIPLIESPLSDTEEAQDPASTGQPGQVPPELGKYVMCVDQCAMGDDAEYTGIGRKKRSAINCAFKMKCALSPPDERIQRAFLECETQFGIQPQQKIKESCECLKSAGVTIECPK